MNKKSVNKQEIDLDKGDAALAGGLVVSNRKLPDLLT